MEELQQNKDELLTIAKDMGVESELTSMRKDEVVFRLMQSYAEQQGYILATGILEVINDGYGFLRQNSLKPSANDVYVSQSQIRRFGLRTGDQIMGNVRPPKDNERYFSSGNSSKSFVSVVNLIFFRDCSNLT